VFNENLNKYIWQKRQNWCFQRWSVGPFCELTGLRGESHNSRNVDTNGSSLSHIYQNMQQVHTPQTEYRVLLLCTEQVPDGLSAGRHHIQRYFIVFLSFSRQTPMSRLFSSKNLYWYLSYPVQISSVCRPCGLMVCVLVYYSYGPGFGPNRCY
jgi:hypothetical protein